MWRNVPVKGLSDPSSARRGTSILVGDTVKTAIRVVGNNNSETEHKGEVLWGY